MENISEIKQRVEKRLTKNKEAFRSMKDQDVCMEIAILAEMAIERRSKERMKNSLC